MAERIAWWRLIENGRRPTIEGWMIEAYDAHPNTCPFNYFAHYQEWQQWYDEHVVFSSQRLNSDGTSWTTATATMSILEEMSEVLGADGYDRYIEVENESVWGILVRVGV